MNDRVKDFFDMHTSFGLLGVGGFFATITFNEFVSGIIGILTICLLASKLYLLWFPRNGDKAEQVKDDEI